MRACNYLYKNHFVMISGKISRVRARLSCWYAGERFFTHRGNYAAGSAVSQNGRLRMPLKSGPLIMPTTPTKKRDRQSRPWRCLVSQYIPV
jgi:hypothetical protein